MESILGTQCHNLLIMYHEKNKLISQAWFFSKCERERIVFQAHGFFVKIKKRLYDNMIIIPALFDVFFLALG